MGMVAIPSPEPRCLQLKGKCMGYNIQRLSLQDQQEGFLVKATVQSEHNENMYYNVQNRKGWSCDCPHWLFRHPTGGCKHIRLIKQAIRS